MYVEDNFKVHDNAWDSRIRAGVEVELSTRPNL